MAIALNHILLLVFGGHTNIVCKTISRSLHSRLATYFQSVSLVIERAVTALSAELGAVHHL